MITSMKYSDIKEGMILKVSYHTYPGDNRTEVVEVEEFDNELCMGPGFWCKDGGYLPESSYGKFWSIEETIYKR